MSFYTNKKGITFTQRKGYVEIKNTQGLKLLYDGDFSYDDDSLQIWNNYYFEYFYFHGGCPIKKGKLMLIKQGWDHLALYPIRDRVDERDIPRYQLRDYKDLVNFNYRKYVKAVTKLKRWTSYVPQD